MLINKHHCISSTFKSIFPCIKNGHLLCGILAMAVLGNTSVAAFSASSFITLNPKLKTMNSDQTWQQTPNQPGRFWVRDEALLWWFKSAPVSAPLLSTYTPGSPSALTGFGGAFGLLGTRVLSPDQLDYNGRLGDRLSIGMWIDDAQHLGIEGNAFVLRTGSTTSGTFSNSSGSLPLRALFINTPPGAGFPPGESSFVLADPHFATGGQSLYSSIDFWGTELNGLYRFWNNDMVNLFMSGGFRYLGLHENMTITDIEKIIGGGFGTYTGTDNFGARNQFYSGQLGMKAEARYQQYFSCIQGNVALGVNQQTVALNGNSAIVGPHNVTMPGGIYVQKSNTGTQTKNEFSVAPEVKLEFGMDITKHISALFGYDFIYMSNVVRPGDQIDRTINFTQNAVIDTGVLVGAARPQPLFHTSSFWAQGISLGLQLNL